MDIKEIIECEFGLIVHDIFVLGQGLDSIAYLVNDEYVSCGPDTLARDLKYFNANGYKSV